MEVCHIGPAEEDEILRTIVTPRQKLRNKTIAIRITPYSWQAVLPVSKGGTSPHTKIAHGVLLPLKQNAAGGSRLKEPKTACGMWFSFPLKQNAAGGSRLKEPKIARGVLLS